MMGRKAVRAAVAMAAILGAGVAALSMAVHRLEKIVAPRRVAVRLLGPASGITGIDVPAHILAGRRPRFFQIEVPSVVAVTLPGGKVFSLPAKTAFVTTEVDVRTGIAVVVDVALLPLLKGVSYREAVAEVRRLMRDMGVEPDKRMRKRMATWPDDSGPVTYNAAMDISEDHGLSAELRPSPDDGWFVVFTFQAGLDARRALWDSTFKAATKPPADGGKGKETDHGPSSR